MVKHRACLSVGRLIVGVGLRKSASAPPRGEAREPGMQLSAFHQDRADRLPEQTQRRVYGCVAPAQRRGSGGVKIFRWGVSPSKSLNTATTSPTYTFGHSNRQAIIPLAYPLPPTNTTYTAQHLYIYANNPRPKRSRGPLF